VPQGGCTVLNYGRPNTDQAPPTRHNLFWLFFRCFVTLSRSSIVTQRCENESLRHKIAPNFFQPDVFVKPVTVLNVKQVLFRHDTHYSFVSCVAVCITAVWKKNNPKLQFLAFS
jgi:hypothetical protein